MSRKRKDNDKEYTPTEILGQVALGNMDPKEAGLTQPIPIVGTDKNVEPTKIDIRGPVPIIGEGQSPKVMPAAPPKRVLGDRVEFQAAVVPLELRAEWEYQDSKIVLPPAEKEAWVAKWVSANQTSFRVQGMVACGNGVLRLDQIFTDPVLGLCGLLREAADKIEKEYNRQKDEQAQSEVSG
jgi:hypothetical protein